MQTKDQKLADMLLHAEKLFWRGSLYCEDVKYFSGNTKCIIINDDRKAGEIGYAEEKNLKFTLRVQTLIDIVHNVAVQRPTFSVDDLIAAFNYYVGNGAFINFGEA
ncbi:MAG: hypothetical protein M1150_00450 [Patescibacteria group bacterium]|nr:hypothetical protein [Patescibacteria group bacterium]